MNYESIIDFLSRFVRSSDFAPNRETIEATIESGDRDALLALAPHRNDDTYRYYRTALDMRAAMDSEPQFTVEQLGDALVVVISGGSITFAAEMPTRVENGKLVSLCTAGQKVRMVGIYDETEFDTQAVEVDGKWHQCVPDNFYTMRKGETIPEMLERTNLPEEHILHFL